MRNPRQRCDMFLDRVAFRLVFLGALAHSPRPMIAARAFGAIRIPRHA